MSGSRASEERIRALATAPNWQSILDNETMFNESKGGHWPFAVNLMNILGQASSWQAGGNVFERVLFAVARSLAHRPQYSAARAADHQSGGDHLFAQHQLDAGP